MQKEYGKKIPELYRNKEDCCGCRACMNVCPTSAISMQTDEYGFYYPKIDEEVCIGCNRCVKACAFQADDDENRPLYSYAAVSKNEEVLKKSASGGIFTELAQYVILDKNGIVYGVACDENWNVQHIGIESVDQLYKLQGSKYVQSDTKTTFQEVKRELENGRVILYSGTPCQIAGLYGYLGKRYENLITVDLVCHGVPSEKMFKEYISLLEEQNGGKVTEFVFRDKTKGWGINGSCTIKKNNTQVKKDLWQSASSYLYYFSNAYLYRESCYSCKYASEKRPADITIGDFWGIEKVHYDLLRQKGWDEKKGISLLVVSTPVGERVMNDLLDRMLLHKSTFENVSKSNHQLREPSKKHDPNPIMEIYKTENWRGVQDRFDRVMGLKKHTSKIKSLIPISIKTLLKRLKP